MLLKTITRVLIEHYDVAESTGMKQPN